MKIKRRVFLEWSIGTLATTTFPRWVHAGSASPVVQGLADTNTTKSRLDPLDHPQWQVLTAVQSHLFPADTDSPGAADINAAAYLRNVLLDPKFDQADRTFVKTGILAIQKLASQQHASGFVELRPAQRERVLRLFERTPPGSRWLNMILEYLMEALLTDPVYGGNPKEIGWRWLGHTPGLPRPPRDKRYFLL